MSRKVGVLSDAYFKEHCIENQFMPVGVAQRLFPYIPARTLSRPLKEKPVAQRGYELNRVARDINLRTGRPYQEVLDLLIKESKKPIKFDLTHLNTQIIQSKEQDSHLAKSVRPRNNNFNQLSRATIDPLTGSVIAKTGRLTGEELKRPEFRDDPKEYKFGEKEEPM